MQGQKTTKKKNKNDGYYDGDEDDESSNIPFSARNERTVSVVLHLQLLSEKEEEELDDEVSSPSVFSFNAIHLMLVTNGKLLP